MTKKSNPEGPDNSTKSVEHTKTSSRRKILKGTLAGVGAIGASGRLPTTWTKPVSEAAVLPAHAQSSGCVRAEAGFLAGNADAPGTWNGTTARTQSFPFACGDRGQDVAAMTDSDGNCFANVSLIYLNVALDRPPGAAGTGTVNMQTNLGNWDQENTVNFPVSANQTNYQVPIADGGASLDQGLGTSPADLTVAVDVPGFSTARIRFNFFASGGTCPD